MDVHQFSNGLKFMIRKSLTSIVLLCCMFFFNPALAETKYFVKEYAYQASDEDSKNSSRTIALREVKRLLLEEIGTYLESMTVVKNFQLETDQITTLTAGIVKTEIVDEKWDGHTYWFKAKIVCDPADVIKSIDNLRKDLDKSKELESIRRISNELFRENERLRKELVSRQNLDERKKKSEEYNRNINQLNASEWLDKSYNYIVNKEFDKSIEAATASIALNPNKDIAYSVYMNRGIAYGQINQHDKAIEDFNKAMSINPNMSNAYAHRGIAFIGKGQYDGAIEDFNKAISINPNDDFSYFGRACTYLEMENFDKAIVDFKKAFSINPNFDDGFNNAVRIYVLPVIMYYQQGQYDKAIEVLSQAIVNNPKGLNYYSIRGGIYDKKGQYDQAIEDYSKAIVLYTNTYKDYQGRGGVYKNQKQYSKAIEDFNKAIAINPGAYESYLKRGLVYYQMGIEQVSELTAKVGRVNPNEVQSFDTAILDFNKAISINQSRYNAYVVRGMSYIFKGQHDKAMVDFEKAMSVIPKDDTKALAAIYGGRGILYMTQGNTEKAKSDFQRACSIGEKIACEALEQFSDKK